jgi:vancomycin resistance protein VanJ
LKWHPLNSSPAGSTLRVVTYNVALRESRSSKLAHEIEHQHPDIICLQESVQTYPPESAGKNNVGAAIKRHFPGWYMRTAGDTSILSRFPIVSSRAYALRGTRRTLDITLETPHGPLRVLSTHISTAFGGQAKYSGLYGQLLEIVPNAQKAAQARLDQIKPLDKALDADSNTPLILCGDFNTPPRGLFYRHLRSRLNDGFAQGGNGLGLTFPSRPQRVSLPKAPPIIAWSSPTSR